MVVRAHKISFTPDRTPMPKTVKIGFEGDNMVERLIFKLPDIAETQTAQLMLGGTYANMVTLIESDDRYYVDLTAELIGEPGRTECYVVINGSGAEVWQSGTLYLSVGDVPDVETEIEQRFPTAVEQMRQEMAAHNAAMEETAADVAEAAANAVQAQEQAQAAAGSAAESADRADAAVDKMPVIGENGNWQLWDAAKGEYVDSGVSASGGTSEGIPGGYYMPSVSAAGVLTWMPSREDMPGVSSANIRGPQGEKGETGAQGPKGDTGAAGSNGKPGSDGKDGTSVTVKSVSESSADGGSNTVTFSDGKTLTVKNGSKGDTGAQGPQGEKGDTGAQGAKGDTGAAGKDGTSITHSWNGTTLTVTSASGTSSANLKGDTGAQGETGAQGPKGDTGAQGEKGEKGDTGAAGADGRTPVKGTDYYTEADKAEMVSAVIAALPVYGGEVV